MNKQKRTYVVEITVDEDHEGAPEDEEVKLQLERAILEGGEVNEEFGIYDCKVVRVKHLLGYKGE